MKEVAGSTGKDRRCPEYCSGIFKGGAKIQGDKRSRMQAVKRVVGKEITETHQCSSEESEWLRSYRGIDEDLCPQGTLAS